jgi:hypothetical protein
MGGFAVMEEIMKDASLRHLTVLALTTSADSSTSSVFLAWVAGHTLAGRVRRFVPL